MTLPQCFSQTIRECCLNIACAPFFLLAIILYSFYYCWPYMAQLPEHLPSAIADEDNSPLSRSLVRALQSSPRLNVIQVTDNRKAAVNIMKEEKAVSVISIPPNFERDALAGVPTALTLVTNGAFIVKARVSMSGASGPLGEVAEQAVAAQLIRYGLPLASVERQTSKAPALISQPMYNTISGYLNFAVPIVFIVIIQTLMLCGTGMLFNAWFMNPKKPRILILALHSPWVLFTVQLAIFCFVFFWTICTEGVIFALHGINSFQNIPGTIFMAFFFALAVSSLGIAIGILLGPTHFVIQAIIISSIPCVFISGNLWPMSNIPIYMKAISWFLPSTPGASGILRASQCGANVGECLPYIFHLLALAGIYLIVGRLLCRWRENHPISHDVSN